MSACDCDHQKQALMPVEEALERLTEAAVPMNESVDIGLEKALGRILARDQVSGIQVPPYDNSAMDGYAVRSTDLEATSARTLPVSQRICAGENGHPLQPGTAARIFTGAPIPAGADAVVMQEQTRRHGELIEFTEPAEPGQNIRRAGEDIQQGQIVLQQGRPLRPSDLGLAASVGLRTLPVWRKLKIAMFSTGDELIEPGEPLPPGKIYNSNRYTLHGLFHAMQCETIDLGAVPDTLEATRHALENARDCADLIITTGGVSVGEEDHVRKAVEQLGTLELWRINIKPGKPFAFGHVGQTPFIGLPGNPVSVFSTFCIVAQPFVCKMQGRSDLFPSRYRVTAAFHWPRPISRQEYLRAREKPGPNGLEVEIYPNQGSGVLTSTSWADGLVIIPPNQTVTPGDPLDYIPFTQFF